MPYISVFQNYLHKALTVSVGNLATEDLAFSPIAVRRVKPIDSFRDAQVEGFLQFSVHAIIVAPNQLVAPSPRAETFRKIISCAVRARLFR